MLSYVLYLIESNRQQGQTLLKFILTFLAKLLYTRRMKELVVNNKYNGKKLNSLLLDTFDGLSLNVLYKALRKKDIRINNVRVSENVVVHTGDQIKVFIFDDLLEKSSHIEIDIIYEDEHICVVNKSAGIEVTGENSLTTLLEKSYNFIKPCHRLDRNTTGLILFAKDEISLSILLDKFKHHEIEKHYKAKVVGIPTKKQITLTAYLFKDAKKSFVYISDTPKKGYEKIMTSFQVIQENKKENTSILDVTLHTGKTHQIRAHLAHIGHPIVGDGKYGNHEMNKKFGLKTQQLTSCSLTFHFKNESGILSYLNEKSISL